MEHNLDKTSGQRKKRCNRTYTKRTRDNFARCSLNDISVHPLGAAEDDGSAGEGTLRRSRSLAISRADIFTHLGVPNQRRRPQLIPRARLVDKSTFKERRYQQHNTDDQSKPRQQIPKSSVIPIPKSGEAPPRSSASSHVSSKQQDTTRQHPQPPIYPAINPSEIDSLDSNYHNKSSFQSAYQVSQENLHYNDLGLSLPNYYPDSKYDTDVSVTAENVSIFSDTDFYDGNSRSLPNYAYEYDSSLSDLEPRYYESNTFNPIFSEPDYQSVSSCSELNNFDEITVNNNKNKDDESETNSVVNKNTDDDKEVEYEKSIDFGVEDIESLAPSSRTSTLKGSGTINIFDTEDFVSKSQDDVESLKKEDDFDEIKVEPSVISTSVSSDHITLITIDSTSNNSSVSPLSERKKSRFFNAKKTKSPTDIKRQNYLKELLENNSSSTPIKNFITKNISRAFGDKERKKSNASPCTEDYISTVVDNQYHSLPDITASKYLQKCEKIDRKLRKCEKLARTKSSADSCKNRFIVNIGQHLNIPNQNAQIPVDFEVKISKVPKIQKTPTKSYSFSGRNATSITTLNSASSKLQNEEKKISNFATLTKQTKEKILSSFKKNAEAKEKVKLKTLPKITEVIEKKEDSDIKYYKKFEHRPDLKTIRNFTKIEEKPENKYNSCSELDSLEYTNSGEQAYNSLPIDIVSDAENTEIKNKMEDQQNNNVKRSSSSSPVQEYQEKLGTMRNFWDKMMNKVNGEESKKTEEKEEHEKPKEEKVSENIIHDSPPPKLTISKFENMKEQNQQTSPKKPEPCKIVEVQSKIESVRKIFEPSPEKPQENGPSLVETNRKIFEPRLSEKYDDKMGTFVKDSCGIFENPYFERLSSTSPSCNASDSSNQFESLNPNIVEIIETDKEKQRAKEMKEKDKNTNEEKQVKIINGGTKTKQATVFKARSFDQGPEFDHVRYKVMKSDRFQKNIFANCERETQFDGLMQYLQDYSFQELLIDNNIVIIEPIRTKVEFSDGPKKTKKITQIIPKPTPPDASKETKNPVLRRHFFYHPIRVNREVNDSELPNPDTVKQVRQFFEKTGIMKKSQSHNEIDNPPKKKTIRYQTVIDPDRDHCSESDSNSVKSTTEPPLVEENGFESLASDNTCCEKQFVSQDVLKKIRECGTCVTYYGGKVLEANNNKHSPLTKAIMEEIKGTLKRNEECDCKRREMKEGKRGSFDSNSKEMAYGKQINFVGSNCKIIEDKITFKPTAKTPDKEVYQGIKFKLIKSNSCSSRLELVGTENVSEYRKKFLERQKYIIEEQNLKNQQLQNGNHDKIESIKKPNETPTDKSQELPEKTSKNVENELDKKTKLHIVEESPKIVAEEMKTNGNKMTQWTVIKEENTQPAVLKNETSHYIDYRDYDKLRRTSRKFNDMEFETYEVLEN